MNIRYRNFRKKYIKRNDISCIWILVGIKNNEDTESWIQIGRSKHLTNLLSEDVKEDIKAILYERNGKYKDLKKEFKNLVFYEVNIEEFLKNDNDEALNGYRIEPQNENLKYVYHYIRAAYTEAKLGYYNDAQLFHTSTVDGFYYKYFKDKNKDIDIK